MVTTAHTVRQEWAYAERYTLLEAGQKKGPRRGP